VSAIHASTSPLSRRRSARTGLEESGGTSIRPEPFGKLRTGYAQRSRRADMPGSLSIAKRIPIYGRSRVFLPAERAERLAGALRQRQRSLRQVLMKTKAAVLPDLHGQFLFALPRCQKRPPAVFLAGAARFTATATEHPQMALGKEGKRHLRVVS
jgi:hypothetical protein